MNDQIEDIIQTTMIVVEKIFSQGGKIKGGLQVDKGKSLFKQLEDV
jgi:hypothetical protein